MPTSRASSIRFGAPAAARLAVIKNLGLIIGVIVAIVIAWWLVGVLFSLAWFIVKLVIVAAVAVLVFFALRGLLVRGSRE